MSDISKINPNGTEYNLKDATARAGIESSKTLKSSVVTVTDAAPINAEDITVDITPIQDLHGYDRPWAGGGWKNKLKVDATSKYIAGVTYTVYEDGTILVNGTSSASTFAWIHITLKTTFNSLGLVAGERYILSGNPDGENGLLYIENYNNQHLYEDTGSGVLFTYNGETNIRVGFIVLRGHTISNKVIKPMIRLATETDPTFAPYSNICPIEGWTGAELTQKDAATNSTVTRIYSTDFGETVYGGKWHVTEGGTDKTHASVVYDGSSDEEWLMSSGTGWHQFYTNVPRCTRSVDSIINEFEPIDISERGEKTGFVLYDDRVHRFALKDSDILIESVEDWKTWLASDPLQVCYELATPTTISTPKQNVPMLKGVNTVYADCGDTQLKYQPDNVFGELKGEIRTVEAELEEAEANLEIVYEDHVANTSMGIIVQDQAVGDLVFSNALDIAKTGYTPIAVTDTSIVHSTVANQGEIATHCLLDVTNNRVRFYVHVMDSAASLTIPPNSLTFRVAYKKA